MVFAVFCVVGMIFASPASPSLVVLSVSIGRSITLPCSGPGSREVEWYFKQPEIEDPAWMPVAKLHIVDFSSGSGFQGRVKSFYQKEPGNYNLTLSPVKYNDLGIYKCQYMDETENILKDVKLNILIPELVSVAVGMPASLPCYGNIDKRVRAGDLDIQWMRGAEKVYQLHNNTITYGPEFENRVSLSPKQALYGNMSLTIKQTQFSDEGDYQCRYNSPKESGKPDSARLAVTASTGLSAGAVVGIVLGVMVILVILAASAFALWKRLNKPKTTKQEPVVPFQAAHAEEQNESNGRTERLHNTDGPEPHLSSSESDPSPTYRPEYEKDPSTEPLLSVSENDPSLPELHLSETETVPPDQIEMQEKMSKSVEPL